VAALAQLYVPLPVAIIAALFHIFPIGSMVALNVAASMGNRPLRFGRKGHRLPPHLAGAEFRSARSYRVRESRELEDLTA